MKLYKIFKNFCGRAPGPFSIQGGMEYPQTPPPPACKSKLPLENGAGAATAVAHICINLYYSSVHFF